MRSSATGAAKRKRAGGAGRVKRGLRRAISKCLRKRPRSCTARRRIGAPTTRLLASTSGATRFGHGGRGTARGACSSASPRRGATRQPKGGVSGGVAGSGLSALILNGEISPGGSSRSVPAGGGITGVSIRPRCIGHCVPWTASWSGGRNASPTDCEAIGCGPGTGSTGLRVDS
jgi:hypothetical protein